MLHRNTARTTLQGGKVFYKGDLLPFNDAVSDFWIAYGNVFLPWQPDPPAPLRKMLSMGGGADDFFWVWNSAGI